MSLVTDWSRAARVLAFFPALPRGSDGRDGNENVRQTCFSGRCRVSALADGLRSGRIKSPLLYRLS